MKQVSFNYNSVYSFFASPEVLDAEKERNQKLTFFEKIKKGVMTHPIYLVTDQIKIAEPFKKNYTIILSSLLLIPILAYSRFVSKTYLDYPLVDFPYNILAVPILEEIAYRIILYKGFFLGQKCIEKITPNSLKGRIFNYVTSPSARLLTIHGIFSYHHGIAAPAIFFMAPSVTLLRETTGDIIAPLALHITQNAFVGIPIVICHIYEYKLGKSVNDVVQHLLQTARAYIQTT